jgi:hypothetical protein
VLCAMVDGGGNGWMDGALASGFQIIIVQGLLTAKGNGNLTVKPGSKLIPGISRMGRFDQSDGLTDSGLTD